MKLWKILLVFLFVFIFFIHCSEKLLSRTIDKAVILEKFKDEKKKQSKFTKSNKATKRNRAQKPSQRCNDFFVAIPQNLKIPQKCKDPYSSNDEANSKLSGPRKSSEKCQRVSRKQFCQMLQESGWNPKWTKRELIKKKNDAEVVKTRRKIQKNLGSVSEDEITKCFPQYM